MKLRNFHPLALERTAPVAAMAPTSDNRTYGPVAEPETRLSAVLPAYVTTEVSPGLPNTLRNDPPETDLENVSPLKVNASEVRRGDNATVRVSTLITPLTEDDWPSTLTEAARVGRTVDRYEMKQKARNAGITEDVISELTMNEQVDKLVYQSMMERALNKRAKKNKTNMKGRKK